MKMLRNTIWFVGMIGMSLAGAWAADSPAIKKDMAQLQGEWSMVSGQRDGASLPEDQLKNAKRVCKGDETTVTIGGEVILKAKFTIDSSKKPKTIDYAIIDGPNKGTTRPGIYELDGDKVKFCFSASGGERPKDFTSKQGDGRTLSEWKREKK